MRHRFINDQSGVAVLEYGLIAALIASIFFHMVNAGMDLVGTNLSATFQSIAAAF